MGITADRMPLVFSAIVPHSPLLMDRIGKTNRRKLAKTLRAYREIERLLYAAKPATLVVISPHAAQASSTLTVGVADTYAADFELFGDFHPPQTWVTDISLAHRLHVADAPRDRDLPITFVHQPRVDYGVAVPLTLLTPHLPKVLTVTVHTALLSPEQHWQYGQHIGDVLRAAPERVAVIASADLSQSLPNQSGKRTGRGAAFDRQLLELLRKNDAAGVVKIDPRLVSAASCCGFLPLVTLLGALDGCRSTPTVLSYEGPFGVGMLTAYFDFTGR